MRIPTVLPPLTTDHYLREGRTTKISIRHNAGDDRVLRFTVRDASGAAVDISGWTALSFQLFTLAGANALTKAGALIGGGTGGQFSVTLTDSDGAALSGVYKLEIQVTGTGIKETPAAGSFQALETNVTP